MSDKKTIGIIGARGHTGAELIRLIAAHPALELAFVSSRELDGQRVAGHSDAYTGELRYENLDPAAAVFSIRSRRACKIFAFISRAAFSMSSAPQTARTVATRSAPARTMFPTFSPSMPPMAT